MIAISARPTCQRIHSLRRVSVTSRAKAARVVMLVHAARGIVPEVGTDPKCTAISLDYGKCAEWIDASTQTSGMVGRIINREVTA